MSDESNQTPRLAEMIEAGELEGGLRFLHSLGMQNKQTLTESSARTLALVDALASSGLLDIEDYRKRLERIYAEEEARAEKSDIVQVTDIHDKYKVESAPEIDCGARIHLCHGRCCTLRFPLSFQDLDEGIIRWNYEEPYQIRQRKDGYCFHNSPETRFCTAYEHRPAVCRTYDCRKDKRIWEDFEAMIPAPDPREVAEAQARALMQDVIEEIAPTQDS